MNSNQFLTFALATRVGLLDSNSPALIDEFDQLAEMEISEREAFPIMKAIVGNQQLQEDNHAKQ